MIWNFNWDFLFKMLLKSMINIFVIFNYMKKIKVSLHTYNFCYNSNYRGNITNYKCVWSTCNSLLFSIILHLSIILVWFRHKIKLLWFYLWILGFFTCIISPGGEIHPEVNSLWSLRNLLYFLHVTSGVKFHPGLKDIGEISARGEISCS